MEAVLAASSDGSAAFLLADEDTEGADVSLEVAETYSDAWRTVEAETTFRGDTDYFIDLAFPVADLYGHFEGVDDQWVFCVLPVTGDDPEMERLTSDLGSGSDLDGLHELEGSWSDAFAVDFDIDGLSRSEELVLGSDPRDRDTDDDGLLDGEESCREDSDCDGKPDLHDAEDDGFCDGGDTDGPGGESCEGCGGGAGGPLLLLLTAASASLRRRRSRRSCS